MWDARVLVVVLAAAGAARLDGEELALLILEDSAPPPRRITPKSVFVAPSFCPDGYRKDSLGRCIQVVQLNQAAQWEFFLQKLNSRYAEPGRGGPQRGPLRVAIPFEAEAPPPTAEPQPSTTEAAPNSGLLPSGWESVLSVYRDDDYDGYGNGKYRGSHVNDGGSRGHHHHHHGHHHHGHHHHHYRGGSPNDGDAPGEGEVWAGGGRLQGGRAARRLPRGALRAGALPPGRPPQVPRGSLLVARLLGIPDFLPKAAPPPPS